MLEKQTSPVISTVGINGNTSDVNLLNSVEKYVQGPKIFYPTLF